MENFREPMRITSRKNAVLFDAAQLAKDKKHRDATGLFSAEGIKLLQEAMDASLEIDSVFFTQKAFDRYHGVLSGLSDEVKTYLVTEEAYEKLSTERAPQGVYACIKKPENSLLTENELAQGGFVLLDSVQNPQNMGAILRSAFAFGFDKIVTDGTCADVFSPKCVRSGMGSLFRVKIFSAESLAETVETLKGCGCRVFCTLLDKDSLPLGSVSFRKSDCFVVGNEGHGASEAVRQACTHSLYIPMKDGAESLNASVAASVVMWEMRKQMTERTHP